jgi:adenosylmethionine-8-amino-7-oxononanoate aminotransferase
MKSTNFLKEHNGKQFWQPMTHPAESRNSPPVILTSAEGVTLTDIDGHKTIDGVGGLWSANLGHSCEPIKDAIRKQLDELPFYNSFRGTTHGLTIELAHELAEYFKPEGLVRSFFTSGGSDGVDTALRLARQYHKVRGDGDRYKFISLKNGYHGTHFGGASVNGNSRMRQNYEPLLGGCLHIPSPHVYRNPFNETDPERVAQLCVSVLEDEIKFQGANTIAAFIMEPVLGAGGVIPPHDSFMPAVKKICEKHGILLIADEVITCFGRAGGATGSRLYGVQPDMLVSAKAMTNGYFPFGAVMINEKIAEAFESNKDSTGVIGTGYTYSGHPVGAAAALASLKEIHLQDLPTKAVTQGEILMTELKKLEAKYEVIGNVRGRGLMVGVELVSDRAAKTPLDKTSMNKIFDETYKAGAMVRISGNIIIISPPLIIQKDDIMTIVNGIEAALKSLT